MRITPDVPGYIKPGTIRHTPNFDERPPPPPAEGQETTHTIVEGITRHWSMKVFTDVRSGKTTTLIG